MNIQQHIARSAEYKKLLEVINTLHKSKKGHTCTVSGTTSDTQQIILNLLEKDLKQAIVHSTISTVNIQNFLQSLVINEKIAFEYLKKALERNFFRRVEKVAAEGEYSIRGDIIIFWSSVYNHPIRASFWGDELESLEIIDETYLNKITDIKTIIIGNEGILEDAVERQTISISSTTFIPIQTSIIFSPGRKMESDSSRYIAFDHHYPTLFFKRLDVLENEITRRLKDNWELGISTIHKDQIPENLRGLILPDKFISGFESPSQKFAVYTDREIFGTIFIASEKEKSRHKINRYLAQLEGEVEVGDYIVHEDYGIATYKGIEQKKVMGKLSDYLILEYAESDILSVPLAQVHKLTKYIGPGNVPPKITRLGKTSWKTIKQKVKASVAFLAKELLKHYAKSEIAGGTPFGKNEWEHQFANEFQFTETPDQKRAIDEILSDLEKERPMNRILVGDVGFGKTEVAIRAAFRAVMNGYQVAILCPTTILVSQHYSVFKLRIRNYPIQIATLSRFGTKQQNSKIVEKMNNGDIDIVIGTHRLLSNDVHFKNLGLIIVDEEQKFGVKQKEKIKTLGYTAHVLSMSATPIPRTLNMALSNLRDISIITTPPPGRKAIKTLVEQFNWQKVVSAIRKEKDRLGQTYFLHNEVRTIESIKQKLEALLPDITFRVAHGQMHPQTLEKIMREFYEHKFDCLICTTIIENGIDIKNVNTIIINKAERFGLSQLYQLRGRIGRNTRQGYAFIFYTQKHLLSDLAEIQKIAGKEITKLPFEKARARLEAILESGELGAGFKIASRDLEIRGAGNLLGKEQHGNISAIGLGLYTQLLADEIERLKKAN